MDFLIKVKKKICYTYKKKVRNKTGKRFISRKKCKNKRYLDLESSIYILFNMFELKKIRNMHFWVLNSEIKKVGKNARIKKASFWLKSQNRAEQFSVRISLSVRDCVKCNSKNFSRSNHSKKNYNWLGI